MPSDKHSLFQAALLAYTKAAFQQQTCGLANMQYGSRSVAYGAAKAPNVQEHKLYPNAVAALAEGRITWREDGVPILWSPH